MPKTNYAWLLLGAFLVMAIIGTGCGPKEVVVKEVTVTVTPEQTATSTPASTPKQTATPTVTTTPTFATESPAMVTSNFFLSVLGTLPAATVDYEYAKQYMEAEYAAGLDDPSFVPMTLCIQNGPEEINVHDAVMSEGNAYVYVEAMYGGEWQDMWDVILIEENGEWLISEIVCSRN